MKIKFGHFHYPFIKVNVVGRYKKDNVRDFCEAVDVFIITQNTPKYRDIIKNRRKGQIVIDLVHLEECMQDKDYYTLC